MPNPLRRMVSSGQVADWFSSSPQATVPSRFSSGYDLSLWTPANMTTAIWLDSDDRSTLTVVNGRVSEWRDKSGNNRHASQATEANRPRYWPTRENNRAVQVLSGPEFHGISYTMTGTGWDVFIVASLDTGAAAFARLVSTKNTASAADWNNSTGWAIISRNDAFAQVRSEQNSAATGNGSVTTGEVNILHSALATGSRTVRINGTQTGTAANGTSLDATSGIRIGRSFSATEERWSGRVCEFLLVSSISTTDRDKLEGYLAHKWGLTAKLPSLHPHKTTAPTI